MPLGVVGVVGVWVGGGRFSHSSAIQPGARPAVPAVSRSVERVESNLIHSVFFLLHLPAREEFFFL